MDIVGTVRRHVIFAYRLHVKRNDLETETHYEKEWLSISNNTQTEVLKRYYDMLYPEELKDNEYIALFFVKTDKNGAPVTDKNGENVEFHKFAKNFEEYQGYINKYRYNFHAYNALATVKTGSDGQPHRRTGNMRQQRVLFIDFDKKNYPALKNAHDFTKMIKEKLPNIFIHACYDSGHGYHYYIIIKPTCKIRETSDFNKEICALVGADTDACKVTQLARIPCTFNRKRTDENGKFPLVKEIDHYRKHLQQIEKFHPIDVGNLKRDVNYAKKQFTTENIPELPFSEWEYNTGGFDVKQYECLCTEKIFHEGADIHERNTWLGRIIAWLIRQKYLNYKIERMCQEWNARCRPPKSVAETQNEIKGWLEWLNKPDHGIEKIGGCWWNIEDERKREIVRKQCDKYHCRQAINPYESMSISNDAGVKMNQKILTDNRLSIKGKNSMSGYEYLVLTVLDKYMPKTGRTIFTVKDLKYRMQYKKHGKWQLCMDISTLKKTLEDLEIHNCIKMSVPTSAQYKKKNPAYDDKIIKLTRGLKDIALDKHIAFYYSVARAFICHQITQNEYKVYLCILNNLKNSKSCTLERIGMTIGMEERNVLRAIQSLEKASLLKVDRIPSSDKGKKYNIYHPMDTDRWDCVTDVESDGKVSGSNITLTA